MKPLILDLFCCAGGASRGYADAGFDVVGVDIDLQPHYPYPFLQMDALEALGRLIAGERLLFKCPDGRIRALRIDAFASIHASPPCQAFTPATRIRQNDHPDLIAPTRRLLDLIGLPYVIENTLGSPLLSPVMLCGTMFPGLRVYRHRLFEANWGLVQPVHPVHVHPITKMGRPPRDGEYMHVVGNFSGVKAAREAMGIDWMTRNELREAIPPAYSAHIGRQMRRSGPLAASHPLDDSQAV